MLYGYITNNYENQKEIRSKIESFAKKNDLQIQKFLEDAHHNKIHWERREINNLVNVTMKNGDSLIVYEASDIARSTLQVLEVMDIMARKGISLFLVRYKEKFIAGKFYDTSDFLKLMKHIEGEFVTKRTTDALARRRAAGLPLGRPKGRKNKSRKLDKHRAEIKKYLALNINKASIAKLVGCHAQTLYNYLEDSNLASPSESVVTSIKKKRTSKATS